MAVIIKRENKDGSTSFRVSIRTKNIEICKTFQNEEDAKLFIFFKEKLINNMSNFDIPIENRITLEQVIEMKLEEVDNHRSKTDFTMSASRILACLKKHTFLCELSFEDWVQACKNLSDKDVFRGSKNQHNARTPSLSTIRRVFATLSSAFSYAISKGIPVENHPLKIVQTFINDKMKT